MQNEINRSVQALIDDLVESGREVGLQVSAYIDGKPVVDCWSGIADERTGRIVDGETLFLSWSTTKGFVATCVHLLAEQGKVEYEEPIASYWPEFAKHGKGKATVLDALAHKVGIPQMPDNVTPEMMADWDAMCDFLASAEPLWEPGSQTSYHAWTFGWILGEIVRRADGRPIERFVQEELCTPLGIDSFFMGVPESEMSRVAFLRQDEAHLTGSRTGSELQLRITPPHVTNAEVVNGRDFLAAVIPGGGGTMNARAIARHYAMLAGYGELDGVRLLSPERVKMISALQTDDLDFVSGARSRRAMGYGLGGSELEGGSPAIGPTGSEFGHGGNGGSLGFADPGRKFAFGLTKSLMTAPSTLAQSTSYLVTELIRSQF